MFELVGIQDLPFDCFFCVVIQLVINKLKHIINVKKNR